ncbi:hypothetical protein IVA80_16385 [Bradyrhizobium sp. 139]|uniref:hypothetical protein n=1 Tax=Bradyrhizobium sp. 139 TaxID=2782616 RepID=UPI001FFBDA63|nr:hypothetical protein [Bradyrhizobium sp. 139]MCK1742398.1 hypothetical protein [Bradyrhizobium sp. 139]
MDQVYAGELPTIHLVGRFEVAVVYGNGCGLGIEPHQFGRLAAVNANDLREGAPGLQQCVGRELVAG